MDRKQFLRLCAGGAFATTAGRALAGSSDTLEASAAIRAFIVDIADITIKAKIGGNDQTIERFLTLGVNAGGEAVVTSIGLVEKRKIEIPPDTLALARFRPAPPDLPPHGEDDAEVKAGVSVFVVGASTRIWEIGKPAGVISIRSISKDAVGEWEPFQQNPAKYKLYK